MSKRCVACGKDMGIFTGKVEIANKEHVCNSCWEKAGLSTWGDIGVRARSLSSSDIIKMIENMKNATCVSCGSDVSTTKAKKILADGKPVCNWCWKRAGLTNLADMDKKLVYSSEDVIRMIQERVNARERITNFVVTDDISPVAKFNDIEKQMIVSDDWLVHGSKNSQYQTPESYTLFLYDQIVDYELLENGQSIASGGVGRAIVGGALFGGVGAIVGASTRSYQGVCEELRIKITVKEYEKPAFYLPLIQMETKKSTFMYKERMEMAQNILSKLQLITSAMEQEKDVPTQTIHSDDKFEEIRKFKMLLEDGIISEEEFEAKKKQLLGL